MPAESLAAWPADGVSPGPLLLISSLQATTHNPTPNALFFIDLAANRRLSSIDKEEVKGFREIAAAVSHVPSISPFGDRWKTMALPSLEVNLTDSSPRRFTPGWQSADVVPWTTPAIEMSRRRPTDAEQLPDQTLRDLLISCGHVVYTTAWLPRGRKPLAWRQ
ncbi:hypothetical protein CSOJ01_14631 [Colletotrichum sojae]|uniref:Uncharacterized protein n=1 Tax=Colletotrichum sojae TaxID=2175907 RepID=A0A8H6IPK7_9PEZI|nr:hypothetical protein CSOJ01_14631 [Colletotrichum sojae]